MLKNYLKVTLRHLWNHKQVTLINIVGLSVGMAVCILMLLYVQDERSYDLFHEKGENIYRIAGSYTQGGDKRNESAITTYLLAPLLETNFPMIEKVVRLGFMGGLVKYGEKVYEETEVIAADSTFFDVFTYQSLAGDLSTALDAPNSVVITETTAEKYFGKEWQESALSQLLDFEGTSVKVTGIIRDMPARAHFHGDFIISMRTIEPFYPPWVLNNSTGTSHYTYVLLPPQYDPENLAAQLNDFFIKNARNEEEANARKYFLQPLPSIHLHSHLTNEIEPNGDITYVYIFSVVAFIILLLACVNYMNLATAKSMERIKEVGIRKAVGASRKQLIGQFIGESVLIALLAFLVAGLLAEIAMPLFNHLAQKKIALHFMRDYQLLLGMTGLAILIGIIAGSYPALMISGYKTAYILRGAAVKIGGHAWLRKGLVVFQFAISTALLMGTFIIYDQLHFMRNKKLGVNPDQVVSVPLPTPEISGQYNTLRNELLADSRFLYVTAASQGITNRVGAWRGYQIAGAEEVVYVNTLVVEYDFFKTLEAKMVAGRDFSRDHPTDVNEAYIINQSAARFLGLEDPVGTPIVGAIFTGAEWSQKDAKIIGVVEDFHFASLHAEIQPVIFSLHTERTMGLGAVIMKVTGNDLPGALAYLEQTWKQIAPERPIQYTFMDEAIYEMYQAEDRFLRVFTTFSGIAILIACLGIFGLASFMAVQRTKEIGIRKVLGASVSSIVKLLSSDFTRLVLIAFVVAVPIAYFIMHRWLQDFAYHIEIGVGVFIMAGIAALVIAWITVSYQSIKAALMNPVESLKNE